MASARWVNGSTRAWRRRREQVLERDGHRCTVVNPKTGKRCRRRKKLEVNHTKEGNKLIVPLRELHTICRPHHVKTFAYYPKGDRA